MSDINFLSNKKQDDAPVKKTKNDNEKIEWSKPVTEKRPKAGFLDNALDNKNVLKKNNQENIADKANLKNSRTELLNLIKQQKNKLSGKGSGFNQIKEKTDIFSWLAGKFKKDKKSEKEKLVNYQNALKEEKTIKNGGDQRLKSIAEQKSAALPEQPINNRLQINPAKTILIEKKPQNEAKRLSAFNQEKPQLKPADQPKSKTRKKFDLLKRIIAWFKGENKIIAEKILSTPSISAATLKYDNQNETKSKPSQINSETAVKIGQIKNLAEAQQDNKPDLAVKKEINQSKNETVSQDERKDINKRSNPAFLTTNLIKDEITIFFNWKKEIIILICVVAGSCLLVLSVYQGLAFYLKNKELTNQQLAERFKGLEQQINQEQKKLDEFKIFQTKLKLVKSLMAKHIYWTNFFKFLEENTIKDVHYAAFSGDTSGSYPLVATGKNYNSIAEQVYVLRRNPIVKLASATGGVLSGDPQSNTTRVGFTLQLVIDSVLFTQ